MVLTKDPSGDCVGKQDLHLPLAGRKHLHSIAYWTPLRVKEETI